MLGAIEQWIVEPFYLAKLIYQHQVGLGHFCTKNVHRDGDINCSIDRLDDRYNSVDFLNSTYQFMAWPCGLTANVQAICSFIQETNCLRDCSLDYQLLLFFSATSNSLGSNNVYIWQTALRKLG